MTMKTPRKRSKVANNLSRQDDEEPDEEEVRFLDEEGGEWVEGIYIPPPPKPALTTEDIGPRLIMTKIVNKWFKSYAGTCIVGPFHKRFNAVIGPNGSGKSNVIDSMLFVFGYRASKIRSKKMSALIHNSEKYRNVQSCTVSVHFAQITDKAGDDYNILPGSEFVVSRTANKDNSSYYELNGHRVQFKEIALLLRKHGIDLDNNRFLILQGEVEQISLMKYKAENEHETGMLEYLEDIIGTARYKEPLAKLMDKHRELADKRNDKLNRVKLVETELNKLREPMEEAVQYLKLENNIVTARNILIQTEIYAIEGNLSEKNYEKEGIELEHNEIVNKLKDIEAEQYKKKKSYGQLSKEYAKLEDTKDKCKQAFEKLSTKDVELQAEMEEVNKNRKKWKKQLETEQKKKVELVDLPAKADKSIKELQAKEEELCLKEKKLLADKQQVLASLKDSTKELQERREVLQEDLVKLRSKVDEAKSAFTIAESKLNIYTSNADNEQKKVDNLKTTHENVKHTIAERKRDIDSLKQEVPTAEKQLQTATREFEMLTTRQHDLMAERRDKTAVLENNRSSMQSSRSRGKVLDSLVQQKRQGNCPGLFGRLGDLGAIDQKYDVAVSTACGALDHIVVDTVDTAEWCIEFLKKHDIGRASFIALNKQEHLRAASNSTIQTPENVPRLYDLIRVQDERIKTAFYFGVRDTLVAKNLDQASRIAYGNKRYRVVTLAGDLIEMSGTMSGGGKQVSRGRMGQSVAVTDIQPQEINRMERELQVMEEEFNKNRERLMVLNELINQLKPKLNEMKLNLNKHTIELESLKTQEPVLLKQLNDQLKKAKQIKLDPNEVKKLTQRVDTFKESFDEAQGNASNFQKQVDTITKEINDKTSGRVQAVDKKINEVLKMLSAIRGQISKDKVSVNSAARNLEKCEQKIVSIGKDIAESEDRLRTMKAQRDEIDTDGAKIMSHLEGLAQEMDNKEEELDKMKKEVAELDKKENQIKGSKIEIDEKLKAISKEVGQLQATIMGCRSELTKLKYHQVPEQPLEELKTYTVEELAEKNIDSLKHEIATCKKALQQQQPNFAAIEDYKKRNAEYKAKAEDLQAVTAQRNKIGKSYDDLKLRRKNEFTTAFKIIRYKLREMYQTITLGGDADLEIIDNYDPFTEGVKLNVRPPKKPWKNITNLSGGEKTLTSLALVFALHYYKPSPLYVMDEIDAALDFKNVSIVAHYIKERTKNAQFIIISLRPNMFELANYIVGICKVHDCTSVITIDVAKIEEMIKRKTNKANLWNTIVADICNGVEPDIHMEDGDADDAIENQDHVNLDTSQSSVHTYSDTDAVVPDSYSESRDDEEEMDIST